MTIINMLKIISIFNIFKKFKRVEPASASLIVAALVPVVTNFISGFFGHLNKPSDYQDVRLDFFMDSWSFKNKYFAF